MVIKRTIPGLWKKVSAMAVLLTVLSSAGQAQTVKTVGPGGNYATLTAAIADLSSTGVSAPIILELMPAYTSVAETFPIVFPLFTGVSSTNTVTVRPQAGATGLVIENPAGLPASIIRFEGTKYVVFDGRPGGTGSTPELTIENKGPLATQSTILFINDASYNTIKYCTVKGRGSADPETTGVILFSTTTGLDGNDHNTIDHCTVRDGSSPPVCCIVSKGSTGTFSKFNSNNTISNCNIFNFYKEGSKTCGIYLSGGNGNWTISGNSIYQTVARTPGVSTEFNGLLIYVTYPNGAETWITPAGPIILSINGNSIGGSAPSCSGSPFTINLSSLTSQHMHKFYGIKYEGLQLNGTFSSISTNTIANISLASNPTNDNSVIFSGISCKNADSSIISGNTIGSGTGTGSISVAIGQLSQDFAAFVNGIVNTRKSDYWYTGSCGGTYMANNTDNWYTGSCGGTYIINNIVGSFTLYSSSIGTDRGVYFNGVFDTSNDGADIISGNTIGSSTTANSIQTANYDGVPFSLTGINISSQEIWSEFAHLSSNLVANLTNFGSHNKSRLRGMSFTATDDLWQITENTVRDLTANTGNTDTGTLSSVVGMLSSGMGDCEIQGNTIYNLSNTNPTAAVKVTGIYTSKQTINISRNFIHSMAVTSSDPDAVINGICIEGDIDGDGIITNNMIRLGIRGDGTAMTSPCRINGISLEALHNVSVLFNSVYIGGSLSGTSENVDALCITATEGVKTVLDNIFMNVRTGGTGGKHYAIEVSGNGLFPAGLTCNHNLFYTWGSNTMFGRYDGTDVASLTDWMKITGMDIASGFGDPNFVNPSGNAATVNLHVQSPTPAEAGGINIPLVTVDFDSESRAALTPADIGADAGNFYSPADIFGPDITYTPPGNADTQNRVLTDFAFITDNTAVSSGDSRPRLYYKKSTDNNSFAGPNTSSFNGWKYTPSNNTTSPYSFTIEYNLLYGGGVSVGDIIEYFVAAQDGANNLSSMVPGAQASGNPPVQNISGHLNAAIVHSFLIGTPLSGTYTIPGSYPSLTGAGGFFEAVNKSYLTGDINVVIAGNLTESGINGLYQVSEQPDGSDFTITIRPDDNTERLISGNTANAMIRLSGVDRVIFDGRYNGSGKYLRFRNTHPSYPTFSFENGAANNLFRNCNIEGANTSTPTTTQGVVHFGSTNGPEGNSHNTIIECVIRDLTTAGTTPYTLICSHGFIGLENININISSCELLNFTGNGIYAPYNQNASFWTITGNSIYNTLGILSHEDHEMFNFLPGPGSKGNIISGNWLGGSAPQCGGSPYVLSGNARLTGIKISAGTIGVTGNTISNISLTNSGTSAGFTGIEVAGGTCTVSGNVIGSSIGSNSIGINGTGVSYGINASSQAELDGNSICNITLTASAGSPVLTGIQVTGGTVMGNSIYRLGSAAATLAPVVTGIAFDNDGCLISNNMICLGGGAATDPTIYGINGGAGTTTTMYMLFNSVNIYGPSTSTSSTAAFKKGGSGGAIFMINNIFSNKRTVGGTGSHRALDFETAGIFTSDYNDLYSVSGALASYPGSQNITTLAGWQSATGQDMSSISTNPQFVSNADLHISSDPNLANAGVSIPGMNNDFDSDIRGDPTDIGADEYSSEPIIWTGITSSSWFLPGNWSPPRVPSSLDDVFIPTAGVTFYPNIETNTSNPIGIAASKNLTIEPGALLGIDNNGKIDVRGTLNIKNGGILDNGGLIRLRVNLVNENAAK